MSFLQALHQAPLFINNISTSILLAFFISLFSLDILMISFLDKKKSDVEVSHLQKIRSLNEKLSDLDKKVQANFEKLEVDVLDQQLSKQALTDRQKRLEIYQREIAQLLSELNRLEASDPVK